MNKLYYDPARPSEFSSLRKLRSATAEVAAKKSVDVFGNRLEK